MLRKHPWQSCCWKHSPSPLQEFFVAVSLTFSLRQTDLHVLSLTVPSKALLHHNPRYRSQVVRNPSGDSQWQVFMLGSLVIAKELKYLSLSVCFSSAPPDHPLYHLFTFIKQHVPASPLLTGESKAKKPSKGSWEWTSSSSRQEHKGWKKEHK